MEGINSTSDATGHGKISYLKGSAEFLIYVKLPILTYYFMATCWIFAVLNQHVTV